MADCLQVEVLAEKLKARGEGHRGAQGVGWGLEGVRTGQGLQARKGLTQRSMNSQAKRHEEDIKSRGGGKSPGPGRGIQPLGVHPVCGREGGKGRWRWAADRGDGQ